MQMDLALAILSFDPTSGLDRSKSLSPATTLSPNIDG